MAEGTTQIRFSRSLYRQDAIESAITAYGALATLSLEVGPSDFRVQVSDIDERVLPRCVEKEGVVLLRDGGSCTVRRRQRTQGHCNRVISEGGLLGPVADEQGQEASAHVSRRCRLHIRRVGAYKPKSLLPGVRASSRASLAGASGRSGSRSQKVVAA